MGRVYWNFPHALCGEQDWEDHEEYDKSCATYCCPCYWACGAFVWCCYGVIYKPYAFVRGKVRRRRWAKEERAKGKQRELEAAARSTAVKEEDKVSELDVSQTQNKQQTVEKTFDELKVVADESSTFSWEEPSHHDAKT